MTEGGVTQDLFWTPPPSGARWTSSAARFSASARGLAPSSAIRRARIRSASAFWVTAGFSSKV
ncbi:hypothetical protein [Streptosporangium sp. 'caverna']|uniref:hypothetical protein n=1 Tax=Streptosporangium sp. 'caverna' TaxID=2202249 RepID=UPI000D7E1F41|nr:hypothetical protein [Streptosporangium sp. 'caverna']AWS44252.1 hypothetical protein DKM19_25785 [Streptosporangium sp. 'caverna']